MILENIEPKDVMKYFEEISAIPRGSKKEQKISDYLVKFAKDRNFDVKRDSALNTVIKKPCTKGYEHVPTIILQGHMDMVWEKNADIDHDFETQGINLVVEDGFVKAKGTTLGADNGIAVAMALAVLDSKTIAHPSLEVLITTDEEVGLGGAQKLDASMLSGKTLINLDTEEEGAIYSSCAGGAYVAIELPIDFENGKGNAYTITLDGLKGGHSGMQIHEEKGNSNKLLGRLLHQLSQSIPFHLVSIKGGSKDNAIPRESFATVMMDPSSFDQAKTLIASFEEIFKSELFISDPDITITIQPTDLPNQMISSDSTSRIIKAIMLFPNGVQSMSLAIEGLVESSINLGVVESDNKKTTLRGLIRSSKNSKIDFILDSLRILSSLVNAKIILGSQYSSWEYNPNSRIRDLAFKVLKEQYGKDPEIKAIHAGLECGLLGDKIGKGADLISIGPNLFDVHSPLERMEIKSVQKTWHSLITILESTKTFY